MCINLLEQYEVLKKDEITNTFDRFDAQGKRCTFCEEGISCQLCSNGPCRIKPGVSQGVCGIDADAMAMRDLLFLNTMGTSTSTFHAKDVAKTLKATALGKTPFKIKDETKLRNLAEAGVKAEDVQELAVAAADAMLSGINADSDTELANVINMAPRSRNRDMEKTWHSARRTIATIDGCSFKLSDQC